MNLRQVEAFRTVMLRGSMTDAANELRTSQPTVSRLIAELEAEIGFKLFDRAAGRLWPSNEGLSFYHEVERSFLGMENLVHAARDIRGFGKGRLRIAAVPAMALGFMPRCIRLFRERFTNVAVSLQMGNDSTVTRWSSSSNCDIGFVANLIDIAQVEHRPLYTVAGVCALPPDHHLAGRDRIVPQDVQDETFISLWLTDGARARMDRIFEDAGVTRRLTLESPYSAAICALVEQGLGIGIVNPITADDHRRSAIVFLPFKPEVLFHGYALFPSRLRDNVLLDGFLKIVGEELERYQIERSSIGSQDPSIIAVSHLSGQQVPPRKWQVSPKP